MRPRRARRGPPPPPPGASPASRPCRNDYDEDLLSVRLGANYTLNRWVSVYANIVWEEDWCDNYKAYDYDRFRGTIGLRFHY